MTLPATRPGPRTRVPRADWVVATLAVRPGDRLLEVGCGRGSVAARLCPQLSNGRMVAIDRSGAMVRLAAARNAAWVSAGRASFVEVALEEASFGAERFDKIFAVNVNLFWPSPAGLDVVASALAPGGCLYLFHEAPAHRRAVVRGERLAGLLTSRGFAVSSSVSQLSPSTVGVCLRGAPPHS